MLVDYFCTSGYSKRISCKTEGVLVKMSVFGERLRQLRTERDLTGTELGQELDLTRSGISSYEVRGSFPDEAMLKRIAAYFNVSVDYLVGFSDERQPIVIEETRLFTVRLVNELIESGVIDDADNISPEITEMIISALRMDMKKRTSTKKG